MRYSKTIQKAILLMVFLCIFMKVFSLFTYLFRNADFAGRAFILDFRSEENNTIDVAYVGASSVYCYYDPMVAWKELGLASYCYSVADMDAAVMISSIKDIQKTQSPQLIICDARRFLSSYWTDKITMGTRNILDSLDFGLERFCAVDYYRNIHELSYIEAIPEYFDLIYYHTNYSALASSEHWNLANNSLGGGIERPNYIFKGYRPTSPNGVTAYFRNYRMVFSEAKTPLLEQAEHCLRDLLEYCQKSKINLMLVVSPYIIQHEKDVTEINEMADIAAEYSVPFLNYNTQEMYDEMNLDFTMDIFDCNHVNCLGARKYTENIISYLRKNYIFIDHRGDKTYLGWEEMYTDKYLPYMDEYTRKIEDMAYSIRAAIGKEGQIRATEDSIEWISLTNDPNFTIFFSLNGQSEKEKMAYCLCFDRFKEFKNDTKECVGVITNGEISFYENSMTFSGTIKMPTGVPQIEYMISRDCADSIICINEQEYRNAKKEGIHAVVFNNNTAEIIDTVRILECDGKIKLIHLQL